MLYELIVIEITYLLSCSALYFIGWLVQDWYQNHSLH